MCHDRAARLHKKLLTTKKNARTRNRRQHYAQPCHARKKRRSMSTERSGGAGGTARAALVTPGSCEAPRCVHPRDPRVARVSPRVKLPTAPAQELKRERDTMASRATATSVSSRS